VSDKTIFIVGGGPSLKDFPFEHLRDRRTIAVNVAVFDVPSADYVITVDYTFLSKIVTRRRAFRNKTATKIFVADFSHSFIKEQSGRIVDSRYQLVYDLADFDLIIKARKVRGLGYTFNDFRTGLNSGYCAMQLAVILGYTDIRLLGIDLNSETQKHYHRAYGDVPDSFNKMLDVYFEHFKFGIEQLHSDRDDVRVTSCSQTSRLVREGIVDYEDM
jgi:hypothetical protein